ncbi:MAG: carbon starvation protein A [Candidatus Omnitrophica bacterium]|nr:carbon starvation protein A [Candidatus Omnitrophota bacterium]MDD5512900.1 carbon starvation protein A [Candidatus Omnitrophota bacterium]
MNSLVILFAALIIFFWGYNFFARKLERLWQVDPKKSTPAYAKYDSVDYIPAKNWLVLFGHHFSSISGAGPIIGPVMAVMLWGWLPALLWVIFGAVFIGGVHDFGSLIVSVKEGGGSVADIASHAISRRAKIIFSLFVWLALILVIAVFAYLCAETFVKEPKIVLPSLGLIPVSMLVGYLLYQARVNTLLATLLGLAGLGVLLFLGNLVPVNAGLFFWLAVLFAYAYFASILPVNVLLQPRDYLSSFLLFLGVGAGFLGIFLTNPRISLPAFTEWKAGGQELWPMLFVTVACGAVSGFHALISSGTSSKQLSNQKLARRIGYGAMIAEGVVAVLAIIVTAVLFTPQDDLGAKLKSLTPIRIYAQGYALVTDKFLHGHGAFIAITILNAFILTTLDTATRISRYLSEELFLLKNRFFSTALVVACGAALAFSGKWMKIWPAFGASNQLVAALTLFVLSCWLISKKRSAKFTLWAACFMLLTSIAALLLQSRNYFMSRDWVLLATAVLMLAAAGVMCYEAVKVIFPGKRSLAR